MKKKECVYIAGPMSGLKNFNIPAFMRAEKRLRKQGHFVQNPGHIGVMIDYRDYWPANRAMLNGCTAIYMLRGWKNSKGANKEYNWAKKHGLKIMFEKDGK